jgi:regulator of sirC expression with transglutaminase-like and TPR domain
MIPKTREDAEIAIKVCASAQGDRFDLTACALACAIHENPDRSVSEALDTLSLITRAARSRNPTTALGFADLMFAHLSFAGVQSNYDEPANSDLIDILSSRKGLPIGIGHIWRHAARAIQAPLHGTDMPGHFIMRLETANGPVFLDPFEGGAIVEQDDLTQLAKRAGHKDVNDRMLRPVSDRVMAVRLQTNLVTRAQKRGDIDAWFRAAHRRAILAPQNYQVALDFSQAAEAAGHIKTALEWSHLASKMQGAPAAGTLSLAELRSQSLNYKLN